MKPFFSVIIPTYNSESTIKACLDSITLQGFTDYEILIIDGCSDDQTGEILCGYARKEPRLKLFREKDKGIYDAMNKGIAMANGEYLYFLGSDDTLFNNDVFSGISEEISRSGAKVIYGNVMMKGNSNWVCDGFIHAGEFDLKRILNSNISHQAIFYHRSVFEKLGNYNLKYPVFADYDFNLRCFANYRFWYTAKVIANFAAGGSSSVLADEVFERDKSKNIIRYFFKRLFSTAFVESRLYIKQAALSKNAAIDFGTRLYCLLAYAKLKTQSLLT